MCPLILTTLKIGVEKVDKHLEQAFNVPTDFNNFEDWCRKIKAATREEMDKAPEAGTNIHQVLEDYLFAGSYPEDERWVR